MKNPEKKFRHEQKRKAERKLSREMIMGSKAWSARKEAKNGKNAKGKRSKA